MKLVVEEEAELCVMLHGPRLVSRSKWGGMDASVVPTLEMGMYGEASRPGMAEKDERCPHCMDHNLLCSVTVLVTWLFSAAMSCQNG